MKKILLIVAVVLCVAIAGTAFAITRNNATPATGTLEADSYLALTLGRCSTTALEIADGAPAYYTIYCDKTASASEASTACTLTITLANTSESVTLAPVTVTLYSDSSRQTPVASGSRKGAGSITITGITASTTYYATVSLDAGLTSEQTAAVGGSMSMTFAKAA